MYRNKGTINPIHYGYPGQFMQHVPGNVQYSQPFQNHKQHVRGQGLPQNMNWYPQPGPYVQYPYQQYGQNFQVTPGTPTMSYQNQTFAQKDSQFLFQNPLHPQDDYVPKQPYMPVNGYPMMNPYPKQNVIQKQTNGMQSFMNSFKSQDGSVDFNKMMSTAGQMINAVNQVSSLVKGFGGIFKA